MLSKHQKYYFSCLRLFGKDLQDLINDQNIRSEIDLKINCSVKTPLHGYNRVAHSELWVPAFSEV